MSSNAIYIFANLLALGGWLMLLALACGSHRVPGNAARAVAVILATFYAVLMLDALPLTGGGFSSLTDLVALFAQPEIALIGWIHYLAFDLFIGAWQVHTAHNEQLPRVVLLPALLLTMILGPMGLLFFLATRHWVNSKTERRTSVDAGRA